MAAVLPPAVDPLHVEQLVASVGIEPFISKTIRQVTQAQLERAAKYPAIIAAKIHLFLNRGERAETSELPPFDLEQVSADLGATVTPEHVTREIAAFGEDGETAVAANLVVQRIRQYLDAKCPRHFHQSLAGPEPVPAPDSEVFRFRRAWNVACDPLSVLDDLNEYALSRDQAAAWKDMYPLTWATLWPITQEQLARRMTVDPNFRLTRQKELRLRILTQQEEQFLTLGRAMADIYAAEAQAAQPKPPTKAKRDTGADVESTAAQRIDSA